MHLKTLTSPSPALIQNPNLCRFSRHAVLFNHISSGHLRSSNFPESVKISPARARSCRLITACAKSSEEFREEVEIGKENGGGSVSYVEGSDAVEVAESKGDELMNQSLWSQMKEIVMFSGPATGLWICAPLMSLISTAVIGLGSSTELAALGPGTVFCDNLNLLFMFLSIATSNMVATSLAKKDKQEVQHQISILLFVGLTCGTLMLLFTQLLGPWALTAFAGAKNAHIVPIASKYVQIRGLSWPAVLYGLVAQSASLGMKDSLGPLKALIVASTVNGLGHIVLCTFLRYGIVGAAWATMASQIIASYMMIDALNKKGYDALAVSVPSPKEFLQIFQIAGPVFVTMFSKVAFYSLITYYATAMGTFTVAAHQVMNQTFGMFVVWGEPLSQTAQSFMPEILYGVPRRLDKARMLLKSLVIIGVILGLVIGTTGMSIPWFFPHMFTHDPKVIHEMHRVLILFFLALSITPCTHSLEGTLLAGRELNFISLSMTGCFSFGALLLLIIKGYGLPACWLSLVGFQWGRFFLALQRLTSPNGMLSDGTTRYELGKLKAT